MLIGSVVANVQVILWRFFLASFIAPIISSSDWISCPFTVFKILPRNVCFHRGILALGVDLLHCISSIPLGVAFVIKPRVRCLPLGGSFIFIVYSRAVVVRSMSGNSRSVAMSVDVRLAFFESHVLAKPLSPRAVSLRFAVAWTGGILCCSGMSCASRSPFSTVYGLLPKLCSIILSVPV